MVKLLWLAVMLLAGIVSGEVAADTRLTVQADKKELVLGESLTLEVRAEDPKDPLNLISLDRLKQNFDVFSVSSNRQTESRKGREVTTEVMTLVLYPLHSGKVHLPALTYMDKTSKELPLSVLESSDQLSRVIIKSGMLPIRPWVRQSATLYLDIYDDGSLQWTPPADIVAAGAHIRQLAETQREEMLDGANYTVHRFAWAITPLREGGMLVRFPMLDAVKFGTRLRYAATPIRMDVAPVPAYLPVHVPVGRPDVYVTTLPAEIPVNRPVNRVVTIKGAGISQEGIIKLLSSVHDDENWHFYPVTAVAGSAERATTAIQTFRFAIPFQAVRAGVLRFPELALPYFDPEKGQIESIVIAGSTINVVNPLWQRIQQIALWGTILAALVSLGYVLWKYARRALKRRESLQRIKNAGSSKALSHALLDFDAGSGKVGGATLQQWLQHMENSYEVDLRLKEIVGVLISAHYDAEQNETIIPGLAKELVTLMQKFKPGLHLKREENKQSLVSRLFTPGAKEI